MAQAWHSDLLPWLDRLFSVHLPFTRFARNVALLSLAGLVPVLALYIALAPGLGPHLWGPALGRFARQIVTNGLPVVFVVNALGLILFAQLRARRIAPLRALALDIPARIGAFVGLHLAIYPTFGEALQLHARRHGETIYHLYNAVVRPEDGVNRSTLTSWGRGKKVPRAAISLEILGRIERRYRLPAGYFIGLSGMPDRAPGDFDLDDISPSERRRLAWHLPEDFNRRPSQEKAEILNWVRRDHQRVNGLSQVSGGGHPPALCGSLQLCLRARSQVFTRADAGRVRHRHRAQTPERRDGRPSAIQNVDLRRLRHATEWGVGDGNRLPEGGAFRAMVRGVCRATRE